MSILFYVTFTLAVPMIMIQLFAAVVIENFEKQQEMEEWSLSPALLEVGHRQRLRLLPSQACHGCQTQTGTLPASVQLLRVMHNMDPLCSLCSSKLPGPAQHTRRKQQSKTAMHPATCIKAQSAQPVLR